jgi:hypothetical protein
MRGAWCGIVLLLAVPALAQAATPSMLGLQVVEPSTIGSRLDAAAEAKPELILAQRVIEREWSIATDSSAAASRLVGGKSEPGAMAMSALLPGAGQLYVGERSGYVFALAEAAGWVSWWIFRHDSDDLRDDARTVAGVPDDPASAWSYQRWRQATGGDSTELRRLYEGDRDAYDQAIDSDPRYAAGWSSDQTHDQFTSLRDRSDSRRKASRMSEAGLWINHLVAVADALRAARFHNLPLREGVELKANAGLRGGSPAWTVALERRF